LKMRETKNFYRDLIEKLSKVNRRHIVRVSLSERYSWRDLYGWNRTLKPSEASKKPRLNHRALRGRREKDEKDFCK
jgi:hypothetical protein